MRSIAPITPRTGRRLNAVFPKKGRCVMECMECNSTELVQNHHVIPRADGGTDDTIPLCRSCHLKLHGLNGDFRRWSSAWHEYYREVDPEGYREHQRNAGRARQAKLRRLLGEDGYREYQRRLAQLRWNGKGGMFKSLTRNQNAAMELRPGLEPDNLPRHLSARRYALPLSYATHDRIR